MKTSTLVVIIVIVVIVIAGLLFFSNSTSTDSSDSDTTDTSNIDTSSPSGITFGGEDTTTIDPPTNPPTREYTISFTSSGFDPVSLNINKGDSIVFVNRENRRIWPATVIHPSHRTYPGSSISKCNTLEEDNIFDACRGLQIGETYTFTFNELGTWDYHDHLSPSKKGTIVVQ